MPRTAPDNVTRNLHAWGRQVPLLRTVHAILGIVATLSSVLVAAKINTFKPIQIQWLAFAAAGSIGLLTAFDLGGKANGMRRAWRRLNAAVTLYEADGPISLEQLVKIYEECEAMIGDVKATPF